MATGKVKWFNNAKGYGFILPVDGTGDLFVHYSSIEMDGYKTLKAGQDVAFDIQEGPKGFHAVNIRPSSDGSEGSEGIEEPSGVTVENVTVDDVDMLGAQDDGIEADDDEQPREGAAGSG